MAQRRLPQRVNVGPQALRHAQRLLTLPSYTTDIPPAASLTEAFDAVSYQATGVGISHQAAPSGSWADFIPATTNCAVVWMSAMPGSNVSATVTIGGINVPAVSGNPFIYDATSGYNELQCFVLMNPPTGTQTVTVTFSGTNYFHATSVYYSGVGTVGSPTFVTGAAGTQPSQTVTSTLGKFYAQAFAFRAADGNSAFTTYDPGGMLALFGNPGGGFSQPLVVGDALGTGADITFSATRNNTSYPWGGVVIPLTCAPIPTRWTNWGTATTVGGMLSCIPSTNYDGGIGSVQAYDLTGDDVAIQLVQPPNVGNGGTMCSLELGPVQSGTNPALHAWSWSNGQLAASNQSGWLWWTTYDPYNHAFLRIREAGGTVYYETSPDGSTWVTQTTTPATFSMSSTYVRIYSGYGGTEPSPGVALWDNLNLAPSVNTYNPTRAAGRNAGPLALRQIIRHRPQPSSPPSVSPSAKIATFTETFNTLDPTIWATVSGTPSSTYGQLTLPCASTYSTVQSVASYDLTDSSVYVNLTQTQAAGNGTTDTIFGVTSNAQYVWFQVVNGQLVTLDTTTGSTTTQPYDPIAHQFLRIRANGSGTMWWESSPDASTWVQVATSAGSGFSVGNAQVYFSCGYDGVETNPLPAMFTDLNIRPSLPTRRAVMPVSRTAGPMALRRTMRRPQPVPPTFVNGYYIDASLQVTASTSGDTSLDNHADAPQTISAATSLDSTTVAYDATGTGADSGASTVTSLSWTHTATAGADVFAFILRGGSTVTVTHDGVAMNYVGGISLNNDGNNGTIFVYRRTAPTGGAKTIAVTFASATYASANSVSYTGVGYVTTAGAYAGAALTASQTISGANRSIVVNAIGQYCGGVDTFVSSSGGTQRYQGMGSAKYMNLVIQDTTSTGSTVFSSTVTATTTVSGSIGLLLNPRAPTATTAKTVELLSAVPANIGLAYSLSWTHTIESNATLLVVAWNGLSQSFYPTITVGGQTMTPITGITYVASGWIGWVSYAYYVMPPAGAQTILINGGGSGAYMSAASFTFANAKAVGAVTTAANGPITVSGAGPNDFLLNVMGGWEGAMAGFTGYNQTVISADMITTTQPALFGYARGSSATFSVASFLGSYGGYGNAALPIKPMIDIQADSALTVTESQIQTRAAVDAPYVESIGTGSSEGVGSWTHTIGSNANLLVVAVNNLIYNAGSPTITFNGTPMTVKSSWNYGYVPLYNYGYLTFYYLWNPPAGTYTLTTSQATSCIAQSFAIAGAAGIGAQVNGVAGAANASPVTVNSLPDQLILNIWGGWPTGSGQEFTGYTPSAAQLWVAGSGSIPTVYGDWINETGTTTSFGAVGHTGYAWAGSALSIGNARYIDSAQTITATTSAAMVRNANVNAALTVTATDTAKLTWNMVAFESIGAGGSLQGSPVTWSHTIGASANCLIVGITTATFLYAIPTCQVGLTYLKLLGIQPYDIANNRFILLWGLMNPPTGVQTITVTGASSYTGGNSVAYSRVGGFSAPTYTNGTGTSISSLATGGVEGGIIVQALGSNATPTGALFTNYSQTARVNMRTATMFGLLVGDNASQPDDNSSVTFTASQGTAWAWGSDTVVLYPAYNPPTGLAFDAMGHGWGQSTAVNWTVDHVASQDAYVFVDISVDRGATLSNVQYGGQAMTLLGSARFVGYTGNAGIYRYMYGPVSAGHAVISGTFSAAIQTQINSVSYVGIGKTTAIQTTASDSGTPSQTVSCSPGQVILESIGIYSNAMTAPSGGSELFFYGNTYQSLVMNQATASDTFATTNSGVSWGAIATVIDGPNAAPLAVTFVNYDPPAFVNAAAWFADSPLQITATPAGVGVRNAMVDSTQTITATVTGNSIWALYASVAQTITASPSGAIRYGAVGDTSISITATLSALVKWALKANVTQAITASPSADSLRNANVDVVSPITVSPTSNAIWDLKANVTEAITATITAAEERTAMVDAAMPITVGRIGLDTVNYESTGVGATQASSAGFTMTWNHTIGPTANYVIVAASHLTNGASSLTAKCGGVSMTLLGSVIAYQTSPGPYSTFVWGLANPPSGVVSMSVTCAANYNYIAANSVAYTNVATVTEITRVSLGTTTTPSMTVPATTVGQRIVNAWSSEGKPPTLTFANETLRSWQPEVDNVNALLYIGDAAGTGSPITFSATSSLSGMWGGVAIALQPAPTSTIATQGAATQAITVSPSGTALRNAIVNVTQSITASPSGAIVVDLHGNVTIQITQTPTGAGVRNAMVDATQSITASRTSNSIWALGADVTQPITVTPSSAYVRTAQVDASQAITATGSGGFLRNAIVNVTSPITASPSAGMVVSLHGNVTEQITVTPTGVGSYGAMAASSMQITATDTAFISYGAMASALSTITLAPTAALPTVMALASAVITANTISTSADWTGETNTTRTIDTPQGLLGVLVTLIGGGAAGGNGRQNGSVGWGGGGGARVDQTWIPAASLGPTISMTWGTGGASAAAAGNDSVFTSGGITLTAGGGKTGVGGTASAVGISTTVHNGSDQNTDELTGNAGAGGGSGGAWGSPYSTSVIPGQPGGSSMTVTGGARNSGVPADATAGNGGAGGGGGSGEWAGVPGAGGHGGKYGGGGGGGGISVNYNGAGGAGGDGYTQIIYIWRQGATADVTQAITATPSSTVKWAAKANVTQAITASPSVVGSRGQTVNSTEAITVTPDATGSRGQTVDSTEQITLTTDSYGSRGRFIDSPLIVTTDLTAAFSQGNYGESSLEVTASQPATVIWHIYVDSDQVIYFNTPVDAFRHFIGHASLFVTAGPDSNVTWDTTADSEQIITTIPEGVGSRGQRPLSTQLITLTTFGDGSRGQFLDSDGLLLTADFTGAISYGATGDALQAISFVPITSDTLLDNHAYAALAVSVLPEANVIWDTTGDSGIVITARRWVTMGQVVNIDAALQVLTRFVGIARATFGFDAAQTITATPTSKLIRGQLLDVAQAITATPAGGIVWHGRIGAPLRITATPLGNAIWDAHANSQMTVTESGLIVVSRGQDIDPALDITVDTSGEFTQTMSGDVEQAILALPDTELSLGSTMDSALSLIVTYSADIGEALRGGNFFYFYL